MVTYSRTENRTFESVFLVVDIECVPILGLEPCKNLKLINLFRTYRIIKNWFWAEFLDSCEEKGTLSYTHLIKITENFTPAPTPVQRVPHVLKPKIEKELKLWHTSL